MAEAIDDGGTLSLPERFLGSDCPGTLQSKTVFLRKPGHRSQHDDAGYDILEGSDRESLSSGLI
jgi:hypothetical protein